MVGARSRSEGRADGMINSEVERLIEANKGSRNEAR